MWITFFSACYDPGPVKIFLAQQLALQLGAMLLKLFAVLNTFNYLLSVVVYK